MVDFIKSDLEFILSQILIAEAHASGTDLRSLLPNVQVPFGLRTVDGSYNNLVEGQTDFGAADTVFPRLTDPIFRDGEVFDPDGAGPLPGIPTSYDSSGFVYDSQPRIISNLIVDQTGSNPAALAAAEGTGGSALVTSPGLDGIFGTADDTTVFFIPNVTPDAGLSAPFNAWMTFFGQFFDHGLDLVTKGGNEVVFIPLQPDDPLYVEGSPTNFMVLTRATQVIGPGADGILGTDDDTRDAINTTSPFVDQNQTYASHPSHQVFLRAYELGPDGKPYATGKLIENCGLGGDGEFGTGDDVAIGGMATWAVLKAQARDILGINLTDADVFNVPLLATDAYGNFIKGPNGFPQVVMRTAGDDGVFGTADDGTVLVEGDPTANGGLGIDLTNAVRTGHAFLDDIAHTAVPRAGLVPDDDTVAGGPPQEGTYDNELLDAHYVAGDGRVNENIGLTAVHAIFHSEHNRLVEHTKDVLLAAGDLAFLNQWLLAPVEALPTTQAEIDALRWNGERLFQAAKFGTEMQYQHLVFEEFARTIQPNIDEFLAPNGYDTTIDASIVAEFAHTVYRFGHSMLTETVDRYDADFSTINGDPQLGLIAAFLNPLAYAQSGLTPEEATGAIVRGVTRQVGNEIDEFVTEALRNNLLGLPLDLAAINLARGRDTGVPPLNAARAQFYEATGDSNLKPYLSWAEFAQHLKHPESLINFIAAYGTHSLITSQTTLEGKRAAAFAIVVGEEVLLSDGVTIIAAPEDRLDFLNSTGAWANDAGLPKDVDGVTTTGLGSVDFWIGGLAEKTMPFGGLLGSTFNFVFETQLEALQNGDRFYYLARTAGMHFGTELENNSFAKMVMLNSDVKHLPNAIFTTPTWILEVDPTKQYTGLGPDGRADPTGGITINGIEVVPLVVRDNPATAGQDTNYLRYTGEDHVVLGGTAGDDIIISGDGDDTLYGDEGNDYLEGGFGNDTIMGGAGDDIIQDAGGDDRLEGGDGNDVIHAGNMMANGAGNLILGGRGKDFIITTEDISTTFGGEGDDFIYSAKTSLPPTGNEGDDWIEWGTQDGAPGDNFAPLLADDVRGNDIFIGGGGFDEMIGEGGDDIFVGSDAQDKMDGMSGFDWVTYKNDRFGVTVDLALPILAQPHGETPNSNAGVFGPVGASPASILDRFAEVEGLSGSAHADILRGDNVDAVTILNHGGATGGALTNVGLIDGLQALLGEGATGFATGNIILGGDGSDIIEGRGGDDLIDGDAWLNVRISIRDPNNPEIEWGTTDSMLGAVTLTSDAAPADWAGRPLHMLMLSGAINPGQLEAVREILPGSGGFDTAVFSGLSSDYSIVINDNGTPGDFSDDIVTVIDSVVGRDGSDTLKHIERLQFADISITLVPGLNEDPFGNLTILDDGTGEIVDTPTAGQLLRVSIADVLDLDNVSSDFAITGAISYIWQVERDPGSGIFEDIILLPAGDLAFQSADGSRFRVTPDVAGLSIRVKAYYQDEHGVTETVFSQATQPVLPGVPTPPAPPPVVVETLAGGEGIHLIRSDLDFILQQIKIAEAHAQGQSLLSLLPNVRAPLGLRTVDGSENNLVKTLTIDQTEFGAADNVFPRVTEPNFRGAEAPPPGFGPPIPTSYTQTSGLVFDSQPRIISNLIVDQTADNPAAYAAAYDPGADGILFDDPNTLENETADNVLKDGVHVVTSPGLDGVFGTSDDREVFFFENVSPDEGLSAPFNAWMTFFGQFFDHGLDLVTKGGSGTVFIPLQPDDPLYVEGSPTNFMILTRATNLPGPDGILGTSDDIHEHTNTTSPFVDQNQTYASHPSHQVFLRAYELGPDGKPYATGGLIENRDLVDGVFGNGDDVDIGGMATWAVLKAQARDILGINLTDADVFNVPLLATDPYGNFIKGPNGFPQVVMKGDDGIAGTADDVLVEGNPLAPIDLTNAVRTGHAFLDDIAHAAAPVFVGGVLAPDSDSEVGLSEPGTYDNELLDAHYMAGDGRVNENIGLTAVHAVFHAEHNRLLEQTKATVLAQAQGGDIAFLNEWLRVPVTELPEDLSTLQWNGERLFQVAKFGTEMQYQHLVFEEFARTIQPNVDLFFAPTQVYDVDLDASIVAEFAHTVYRFGHSMLTETVDRYDAEFNVINDPSDPIGQQLGLIKAFLNPLAYAASGPTPEEATGAIVRGVTRTIGNEIDEFVTEALRNNLLGLPLDLAAINLARGRDTGIPTLNDVRRQIYEQTGDSILKPYTSWADLVQHLKHPESLVNFIAAYGTHEAITSATTLAAKREAALLLTLGDGDDSDGVTINGTTYFDRLDFLNSTGDWANDSLVHTTKDLDGVTVTGLGNIDLWIGGLAERKMPFGGMLGSTFNFIFENQLEKLQDGDRFYYLERTAGLAFNAELESNSFAKMIMANTDATHLPALVFTTPKWILEVDQSRQFNAGLGSEDPTGDSLITPLVIRDNPNTPGPDSNYLEYTGEDHVVLGGTNPGNPVNPSGNDILIGGDGDDTIWGDGGNDRIDGGYGNDNLRGGAGDDIITDLGGDDNIQGGDGNDVIHGGNGINLLIGGFGQDFIITGEDSNESIGGPGNDFILGTKADEQNMGNEGDDWIEGGTSDGAPGDNFDPLGNDPVIGNDVFVGRGEHDKFNGEGGDDIMVGSVGLGDRFIGASGYDWATFKNDPFGVYIDITDRFFDQPPVPGSGASALTRFDFVEGLSGSAHADVLKGDDADATTLPTAGARGSVLTNFALIAGLEELLAGVIQETPEGVRFFDGGNIILGGAGSDLIEGRGGDDVIDGDAWLNVRISVRAGIDPVTGKPTGPEIATFDSMVPMIPHMLSGEWSPGQLEIVREILYVTGPDFDTAQFSGDRSEYVVTIDDNGTPLDFSDDIVTVADTVAGRDGTDTLKHIERLQFRDQSIVLNGLNGSPQGAPEISDATPTEDQLLTVSLAGLTDPDNVSDSNPTGAVTGPVDVFWQFDPGTGIFEDILNFAAGEVERVQGLTFRPTDDVVGNALRVRVVYKDASGVLEEVYSAPTALVENVNDPPAGSLSISDSTPTEGQTLSVINQITDADGLTAAVFAYQWQVSEDGNTWADIDGGVGPTFVPGNAHAGKMLRVVATYTDDQGTTETVTSAATQPVENIPGPPLELLLSNFFVLETATDADVIATVAVDDDPGETHTFVIDDPRFEIVNGELRLTSGSFLDDADVGPLSFLVTVTSDGDGLSADFPITLIVLNVNEAPGPVGLNSLTVLENDPGAFVGTLQTSDPDVGDVLTLSVDDPRFEVVSLGGTFFLKLVGGQSLDFETEPSVTVHVTATDQGGLSGPSSELSFLVTDVLDTPPVITSNGGGDTAAVSIAENTTAVGTITATGGPVTFSISGGADADRFTINAATGILAFLVAPDFEIPADSGGDNVYDVIVRATNSVSLFDEQALAITITDVAGITLNGTNAANTLNGTGEADTLSGLGGNDILNGLAGNDILNGGAGNDILNGDAGDDTLSGDAGNDTLNGGTGNDTLLGGAGTDVLNGGEGNDTLAGGLGNDIVNGGEGDDVINYAFGDGADIVDGGAGTDTLNIAGTAAANVLDVLFNGTSLTAVEGGTVTGIEIINADLGAGVDTLSYNGSTAGVVVDLGAGTASGFASIAGIENVTGGSGNDILIGSAAANVLRGGLGNDTYFAQNNDTLIETGPGIDHVFTDSGSFTLANNFENLTYTGTGSFVGNGNGLANVITGAGGNDTLNGGNGNDTLLGGDGNDILVGGGGNDRLEGGTGNDTMNGGAGLDTFVFGPGFGNDTIIGFDANAANGQDLLDVSALGITAANFAALVTISDLGNDTLVTIDSNSITLVGVSGVGANSITINDFILA
jgi:Ca2+-binding RTX toxin-like protein